MIGKNILKYSFKAAGIFCSINLLSITVSNAYIYSHFDKGLQKAKEYEQRYQKNNDNENRANTFSIEKVRKSPNQLEYRQFSLNRHLNAYFSKFTLG